MGEGVLHHFLLQLRFTLYWWKFTGLFLSIVIIIAILMVPVLTGSGGDMIGSGRDDIRG